MTRLSRADLEAVIAFLGDVQAIPDMKTYPARVLSGLRPLVSADIYASKEFDLREQAVRWHEDPPVTDLPELAEALAVHAPEHPVVARHRSGDNRHPYQISDFLSRREFQRLGLYNEFYRHIGVEDQIAVGLAGSPSEVIGIALSRDRRYSERERSILDLVRPHLVSAFRSARDRTELRETLRALALGVEASGHAIVVLDAHRRIAHATPRARRLLAVYFPGRRRGRLPEELDRWAASMGGDGDGRLDPPDPAFIVERSRRLEVRYLPSADGQPFDLLLLRERREAPPPEALVSLGLTRREREVAALVARGKTNQQIARLLGVRLTTVKKHLEHAYEKLGVRSRAALTARVMEAAG